MGSCTRISAPAQGGSLRTDLLFVFGLEGVNLPAESLKNNSTDGATTTRRRTRQPKKNTKHYDRTAYPYYLEADNNEVYYLYSIDDQRMYKKVVTPTETTTEFYLQDATGKTVALRRKVGSAAASWEYYVTGAEREARIKNVTHDGDLEPEEIEFYLYDHLGKTRVVYEHTYAGGGLELVINYVADYFPYGKVLREYVNTNSGDPEKFLTTQHERDKETGLDYRGARFYDSDIARFLSLDPLAREFPAWSAYNYVMGNPIIFIDPTGRSPEGAGDDKKEKEETPASFDPEKGGDIDEVVITPSSNSNTASFTGKGQLHNSFPSLSISLPSWDDIVQAHSAVWNSSYVRSMIPDVITVGGAFNGIAGVGASTSIDFNFVLRGPEASWTQPILTTTQSVGGGFSIGASLNIGGSNYHGDVEDIKRNLLETDGRKGGMTYWGSFGGNVLGAAVGVTGAYTPLFDESYGISSRALNIGVAVPLPGSVAGGVSNTYILKDYAK